jgi:hypothetical protein
MLFKRQDIDDEKWNAFVESSPQGYIYHYTWYLDIVCPNWEAVIVKNSQEWLAIMPLNIKKKWSISYILQPPLTQFLGILFKPQDSKMEKTLSDKKDWVNEIILSIPKKIKLFNYNFSPYFDYALPFYWHKHQLFTRYNYELDLSAGKDKLLENLHTKTRYQIKKAEKENNVVIEVSSDIGSFINEHKKTGRTFLNINILSLITALYEKAYISDKSTLLIAKSQDKILTGAVFMKYKKSWINLYGSLKTHQESQKRPTEILLWKAIEMAIESGAKRFDFEGSMIEGVERFYRKFGGKPVPYLNIQKNHIPLLKWIKK